MHLEGRRVAMQTGLTGFGSVLTGCDGACRKMQNDGSILGGAAGHLDLMRAHLKFWVDLEIFFVSDRR